MKKEFIKKKPETKTECRSLPVFFANEMYDLYIERFNGTCFVINFKNQFFIVTAEHVLRRSNNDLYEDKEIMLNDINYYGQPFHVDSKIIIPYDREKEDDYSHKDLVVFPIKLSEQEIEHQEIIKKYAYSKIVNPALQIGEDLFIFGYPSDLSENLDIKNWTDFDSLHHHLVITAVSSTYLKDSSLLYVSEMKFHDHYTIGGMSGSPVYVKRNGSFVLCGIVIMGPRDCPGDVGYFIQVNVLYSVLNKINGG